MAKQRKIVLVESGVLAPGAIRAYLEETLSDEQRVAFERMVEQDPFAADALEGFRQTGNVPENFLSTEEIAQAIRTKTGAGSPAKSVQLHWSLFAYAAAIIAVVVGVGFFFSFYKSSTKSSVQLAEVSDTIMQTSGILDTAITEKESLVPEADTTSIVSPPVLLTENKPAEPMVNEPAAVAMQKSASALRPTASAKEGKEVLVSEAEDAMATFNNGDYAKAEAQFNNILKKTPNNPDAQYFGAISAYINGNTVKAEKQFDQLLKEGAYVEGSKWYKANILLKNGKKDDAVDMLRSLSISSGTYKSRAIKKLEEIEE